ncbi:MAG: DUF3368 domain-containing protein [Clostridia bacterium]|nr:DUF3368 domain-containing protein [Clostridia bacterium]
MIVVSDSTPMITLMKAMHLDILHDLFGEIEIPEAVFEELTTNIEFKDEADLIRNSSYIRVVRVQNADQVAFLKRVAGLDQGESEAIIYADEIKADVLLMDETAGRTVAQNMRLPITGSVGVLIRALHAGFLAPDEADEAVIRIRKSNRHISEHLLQKVLAESAKKRVELK